MYNGAMTRNVRSRHVAIVLLLVVTTPLLAQVRGGGPPAPIDRSMASADIESRLDAYFEKLAADDASGVALVARNGVPVFFGVWPRRSREEGSEQHPHQVQSRLDQQDVYADSPAVAAGKLSMTDTLGKFFPDYPQAVSRAATVEQLLTMRGGLADFFGDAFTRAPKSQFASNADYFKFVGSQPPLFSPGERNQYCNGCYIAQPSSKRSRACV